MRYAPGGAGRADLGRTASALFAIPFGLVAALGCGGPDGEPKRLIPELSPSLVLGADEGPAATVFYRPVDVDIDPEGNILVLDAGETRILEFSPEGGLVGSFGGHGQGPGEFSFTANDSQSALSVSDDVIVVMDAPARRVSIFSREYDFVRSFSLPSTPGGISITEDVIHLVSYAPEGVAVARYSLQGELLGELDETIHDVWPSGNTTWTSVAAQGDALIEAYVWWPLIRLYRGGDLHSEVWLDFSWVADEFFGDFLNRSRETAESFDEDAPESDPYLAALYLLDLDAAPDSGEWLALIGGHVVHVMAEDLSAADTFRIRSADGSRHAVTALASDDSGSMMCVVSVTPAIVQCYRRGNPDPGPA